jgi:histidyl-tRNA synthetase
MTTKTPKEKEYLRVLGTRDLLPQYEEFWKLIAQVRQTVADLHDFHFLQTGSLEMESFVAAALGPNKEPYALKPRTGKNVALVPAGDMSVVRAYLDEHLGHFAMPLKVHRANIVFQGNGLKEDPLRQSYEIGLDILGDNDPVYDVQVILAAVDFFRHLKLPATLAVSTVGSKTCQMAYKEKLRSYEASRRAGKEVGEVPTILDCLSHNCNQNFRAILELLEDNGVTYELDLSIAPPRNYFTRTVFEFRGAGGQLLARGGRYDTLSEIVFKKTVPAVGVSIDCEALRLAMENNKNAPRAKGKARVFFIAVGEAAKKASLRPINEMRIHGLPVMESLGRESLKAQLKSAEKAHAPVALIFGQREAFEKEVIIRDMTNGAQETIRLDKLVEEVKKRLK